MANVRATKSGLSRETQAKINSKYDPEQAAQCMEWVKETVNTNLGAGEQPADFETDGNQANVYQVLKNGVILARLANSLIPKSISANKYASQVKMAFKQMELIELFIKTATKYGVSDHERFATVDLYEQQNMYQVLVCLQSLSRKAKSHGLTGFGPKESDSNKRDFTEEQLKAGKNVIGLQMGTNKLASQSGMTFGKQRMILD